MPARTTRRKPTQVKTGVQPRHLYAPADNVTDESWKTVFPMTEPLITVTLDRGTFEWLWDFTARKGRQADASNFHYSDIHRDIYQRGADQFANAAHEAFGDTYLVAPAKPAKKAAVEEPEETPAEAPVEPVKRRRRRRPATTTEKSFEASKSPVEPPKTKRRRRPRSEA